jgi:hypothetical protein
MSLFTQAEKEGRSIGTAANGDRHALADHRMCVRMMMDEMACGHLRGVEHDLSKTCVQNLEASDPEYAAKIAECRAWAQTTSEYERVHGEGSAIDRSHPYWAFHEETLRIEKELANRPPKEGLIMRMRMDPHTLQTTTELVD